MEENVQATGGSGIGKWIVIAIVVIVGGFLLFAGKGMKQEPQAITVGVSQITAHPVFDSIKTGIVRGFEKAGYTQGTEGEAGNITFDFENAQGDPSVNQSIAQKFASGNYDVVMPLGTPASQAVVNLIKDRPVVFGAVTDPVSAGLVASSTLPGGNVTGTSDITLYKEQLELLRKIAPEAKRLGIVYNPGEANARFALDQAKLHAGPLGFTVVTAAANTSGDVLAAARSISSRVDAYYMLPDNTVIAGQEALIQVALEKKKPLITIDQSGVEKGGLATLGTNYEMVGERTAEIAIAIIKGDKTASTTPVLGVTDADVFVNLKTAAAIGITLPADLISAAKQKYE